ncbi:MAG: sigma-70 family RNA polymerase sigma factor [Burkholderiales bacterium]|nr:sigma-70 family RNA polymerase sigma factor [Burkholderiales bacterium]
MMQEHRMDRETHWSNLMRRAQAGESRAYETLLTEVSGELRRLVARRLPRYGLAPHELDDIVQDVLIGLHRQRASWDGERAFLPWLHAVVRYKVVDCVRRAAAGRRRIDARSVDDLADILAAPEVAGPAHVDDEARARLALLSRRQRRVVEAIGIEGVTIAAAATRFAMSETAVRVTWHRALKRLGAAIGVDAPAQRA